MYVRPQVHGKVTTLGVSGKLWRDSLILYDRATRSLWSQISGRAVAGPLLGTPLEELPSELTTWGEWRARHPDTLVLVKPPLSGSVYADYHHDPKKIGVLGSRNPDDRLPGKEVVYGLLHGKEAAAVPFTLLEREPVLDTELFGLPAVVFSPPGEKAAAAYERTLGGRNLTFERVGEGAALRVRDRETGSSWSWETGKCTAGELAGSVLERIEGTAVYWGIWARFHPRTAVAGTAGGR